VQSQPAATLHPLALGTRFRHQQARPQPSNQLSSSGIRIVTSSGSNAQLAKRTCQNIHAYAVYDYVRTTNQNHKPSPAPTRAPNTHPYNSHNQPSLLPALHLVEIVVVEALRPLQVAVAPRTNLEPVAGVGGPVPGTSGRRLDGRVRVVL